MCHQILENPSVDERLIATQGARRSTELVSLLGGWLFGYDNAVNSQTWHKLETMIRTKDALADLK
jgi:hypothetical protein